MRGSIKNTKEQNKGGITMKNKKQEIETQEIEAPEIKISLKSLEEMVKFQKFKNMLIQCLYDLIKKISQNENFHIEFYMNENYKEKRGKFRFEYGKEIYLKIGNVEHVDISRYTLNDSLFEKYVNRKNVGDLLKIVEEYLKLFTTIIMEWRLEKEKVEKIVEDPRFTRSFEKFFMKKLKGSYCDLQIENQTIKKQNG